MRKYETRTVMSIWRKNHIHVYHYLDDTLSTKTSRKEYLPKDSAGITKGPADFLKDDEFFHCSGKLNRWMFVIT